MFSANIVKLKCRILGHAYHREISDADKEPITKDVCYYYSLACKRCGKLLTVKAVSADHEFGFFVTSEDGTCTQIRKCKICGITQRKEVHVGSTHATESSNPCMQNLACDQCGKIVGEIESHDYGIPFEARFPVFPDDYCYAQAVKCNRCDYTKQL